MLISLFGDFSACLYLHRRSVQVIKLLPFALCLFIRQHNDNLWLASVYEGLCAASVISLYPALHYRRVSFIRNTSYHPGSPPLTSKSKHGKFWFHFSNTLAAESEMSWDRSAAHLGLNPRIVLRCPKGQNSLVLANEIAAPPCSLVWSGKYGG